MLSAVLLALFLAGVIGCQTSSSLRQESSTAAHAVEEHANMPSMNERQAEVAEKGASVMPFDLDATTHIFEKTPDGGLQNVVADAEDPAQIRLIREHLEAISKKFAAGNFHDPEMIHGPEMDGLHALVMGHERISIAYREIDRGGKITYSTEDPKLVEALHAWFDAQVSDHGEHAQSHQ